MTDAQASVTSAQIRPLDIGVILSYGSMLTISLHSLQHGHFR